MLSEDQLDEVERHWRAAFHYPKHLPALVEQFRGLNYEVTCQVWKHLVRLEHDRTFNTWIHRHLAEALLHSVKRQVAEERADPSHFLATQAAPKLFP